MWADLEPVGRNPATGGYNRFAWTTSDLALREWFTGEATARGLDQMIDRAGNQWAWWGDADLQGPGIALGSHLDSVPEGGAFDGPLGVVSAFAAIDRLRNRGFTPRVPIGIVNFGDEEGARFGIACTGSRLLTGALDPNRARAFKDSDGTTLSEAMSKAGQDPAHLGADVETLSRISTFIELHVEQGKHLVDSSMPVGVCTSIWPHGRFRLDLHGQANHAGTTKFRDRQDPMLRLASIINAAREGATTLRCVATVGKVSIEPNAVNAIPSRVTAWLDARGVHEADVRTLADFVANAGGTKAVVESFTGITAFDVGLATRLARLLGGAPLMGTAAGHDAGVLSSFGIPSAMLFVRNPTGVSHSPLEFAEPSDCLAGVNALVTIIEGLAS